MDLHQKWVCAYDTWIDGQDCFKDDAGQPVLYDSEQEIQAEIDMDKEMLGDCYPVRADEYIHGRKCFIGTKDGKFQGGIVGQRLDKNGKLPNEEPEYCYKCGQHYCDHNSDGSCVED